jgi:Fe-Mn family superoxide dismutase
MTFTLPKLNFDPAALEPHISQETFEYHHGKHHQAYINKTNELITGTDLEGKSLETVIMTAHKKGDKGLFNQSAQILNHSFYWECMTPNGGGDKLPDALAKKIDSDIGGFENFKKEFSTACTTQFGSGWGWLVMDNETGKLSVIKTGNADLPMTEDKTALLTCDVWEHAYYIDYRNARPKYVETFLDKVVNWDFVAEQLKAGPQKIEA